MSKTYQLFTLMIDPYKPLMHNHKWFHTEAYSNLQATMWSVFLQLLLKITWLNYMKPCDLLAHHTDNIIIKHFLANP